MLRHSQRALFLASLFLLPAGASAASVDFAWRNPLPQGNPLWGVDFESAQVGYAIGDRGTVLRTMDGGTTWTDLSNRDALDVPFRGLAVVAPSVLVALTFEGDVLRSSDGGESWIEIAHPGTQPLREMANVDGVLTALGLTDDVIRSSDGGLTWSLATSPGAVELKGQYWFDAMHGIVVGGALAVVTTDGGGTWQPLPDVSSGGGFDSHDDLDFFGNEGVLVGEFSTWRTHDGGVSWEDVSEFADPIYQRRVFMLGAVTRIVLTDTEGANIVYTDDDGDTWTAPVARNDVEGFYDAIRHPGGGFFAVTSAGDLYRGTTNALGWTNATRAPDDGDRITIHALARRPDGVLFASGTGSFTTSVARWLRSDDGGETWLGHTPPSGARTVFAIDFFDDDLGLAGGDTPGGLSVARTTDGGDSWTTHPLVATTGFVTDIAFVDAGVAMASIVREHNGTVERSIDGGVTWATTGIGGERMECVTVARGDTVYAGGGGFDHTRLYRSADAGASWTQPASAGLPAGNVFALAFLDGLTGFAATNRVPAGVYRTTDGGETWSLVASGSSIRVIDGHAGLLAAGGFLVNDFRVSTDAGLSWMPASLPTVRGVEALAVDGNRLVAGGYGSTILTGVVDDVVAVPPDPRSTTLHVTAQARGTGARISITTGVTSELSVAIFDISGRRVRTLYFDTVAPGTLELDWNGRDARERVVASGVVWVVVRTGDETASRRLVHVR